MAQERIDLRRLGIAKARTLHTASVSPHKPSLRHIRERLERAKNNHEQILHPQETALSHEKRWQFTHLFILGLAATSVGLFFDEAKGFTKDSSHALENAFNSCVEVFLNQLPSDAEIADSFTNLALDTAHKYWEGPFDNLTETIAEETSVDAAPNQEG